MIVYLVILSIAANGQLHLLSKEKQPSVSACTAAMEKFAKADKGQQAPRSVAIACATIVGE